MVSIIFLSRSIQVIFRAANYYLDWPRQKHVREIRGHSFFAPESGYRLLLIAYMSGCELLYMLLILMHRVIIWKTKRLTKVYEALSTAARTASVFAP